MTELPLNYIGEFGIALLITSVVETITLMALIRFVFKVSAREIRADRIIGVGILASALTLPYVWFVIPNCIPSRFWFVVIAELFALTIETIIYRKLLEFRWIMALTLSLVCNVLSFCSGLILF